MNTTLDVQGIDELQISIVPECLKLRDNLLQKALAIIEVKNKQQQDAAVECMKGFKSMLKSVDDSRKSIKIPFVDKIDGTAKTFCEEPKDQHDRLSVLVTSFQDQERRKSEMIQREQERIRNEAIEEANRKTRELEAKMLSAKTDAAKGKIMDKIIATNEDTREAILETHKASIEAAPAQSNGLVFKDDWKFEVTDINALFAAHPDCVKLEPENMMIRARIKQGMRDCAGLRIYNEKKTFTRA